MAIIMYMLNAFGALQPLQALIAGSIVFVLLFIVVRRS